MSERARVLRRTGVAVGGLVIAAAGTVAIGYAAWRRATASRVEALDAEARRRRAPDGQPFGKSKAANLPAPVARYLAFSLPEGQRRIRTARIHWTGEMRLQPDAPWSPYTAEQRFTSSPPGFVWDATVRMMPLVPVRVRDSYVGGEGRMLGRLASVVTVVNVAGTPEMAQGALARWLGEAAWLPTAFRPGEGVAWEAVDDSTARATVTDGAVGVSADFHFAPSGALTRMTAMRYRDVNGHGVLTPFEGRYSRYARFAGMMLPTSAEVAWLLPEGRFAYWRGTPSAVRYELALPALP